MFSLVCVFAWIFACIPGKVHMAGNFDIHTVGGTGASYEFVYHRTHNLLLTISEQKCYFASVDGDMYNALLSDFANQMQDRVISAIGNEALRQITTLEEMRDQFGDLTADTMCRRKDIYIIYPDYLKCDFEQSLCLWINSNITRPKLQWHVHRGTTPTPLTGPDNDHTLGNDQGQYIYMEANEGSTGYTADLLSPVLNAGQGLCLRFWYNMYGHDVRSLMIYGKAFAYANHAVRLWALSGDRGHGWKEAEVTVPRGLDWARDMQIILRAYANGGIQGDIAIDDVSSTPGVCAPSLLDCSFEPDQQLCEWTQVGALDQMDWIIHNGSTETNDTGPIGTFGEDPHHPHRRNHFYLYMEGNNGGPGDSAALQSPVLQLTGPVCIRFSYSMCGSGVGELDVLLLDLSTRSETVLWHKTGNQGNHWYVDTVTVTSPDPSASVQVIFRGTRGNSVVSDIAIDTISAVSGSCDQYDTFPVG